MRILYVFFILVSLIVLLPLKTYAAQPSFDTSYAITYTVNEAGLTHAVYDVTLTNTNGDYYASTYSLTLHFPSIEHLDVSDAKKNVSATLSKENKATILTVTFKNPVVGLGKKRTFRVSFDTPDIAKQLGTIWEIAIPGIQGEHKKVTLIVDFPPSFGKPDIIKPQPATSSGQLQFTEKDLEQGGVSITFGQEQTYTFQTTYHLENTNLFPVKTEVAFPPDTNYQEVALINIHPKPNNVIRDRDGNWLGIYQLKPGQKQDVVAKGMIHITYKPKQEVLKPEEIYQYLQEKPYWEAGDPAIQKLAKVYNTPQKIYDYVRRTLKYDFSRIRENQERLGANRALRNPTSAVCLEFTDLFIALARAAGIPAREIDGFAITQNMYDRPVSVQGDILHSWPEYYDKTTKRWIMIDPTWGQTTGSIDYFHTLDLDHIAFVIKGRESDYPIPAGGYKVSDKNQEKDISIIPTKVAFPASQALVHVDYALPDTILPFMPMKGILEITNKSTTALTSQKITVLSDGLSPQEQEVTTSIIPPWGWVSIPLEMQAPPALTKQHATIKIQIAHKEFRKLIPIYGWLRKEVVIIIGGLILGSFTIILLIIARQARRISLRR